MAPLLFACVLTFTGFESGQRASGQVRSEKTSIRGASAPAGPEIEGIPVPIVEAAKGSVYVFLPPNCPHDGEVNLLVHFHGAPPVLKKAMSEAGLNAVVVVENRGEFTGVYAKQYNYGKPFKALRDRALRLVRRQCPGIHPELRRTALSAWSAGYAAISGILKNAEPEDRIDAVLLADGLHAAFMTEQTRSLAPNALAPFKRFAERAVKGETLLVVTHSEIPTDGYASTTECADNLLQYLGLERVLTAEPEREMRRLSYARRGSFLLEGYEGGDKLAHMRHLWAVRTTLFERLQEFWQSTPTTAPPVGRTEGDPVPTRSVEVAVEIHDDMVCTTTDTVIECQAE